MSAELRARITAAKALSNDFNAAADAYLGAGADTATGADLDAIRPNFSDWAFRLDAALGSLLDELDIYLRGPGKAQPGGGWISGPMS
jgi:hypothetical protein